jgi:hypothetical protein
MNPDLTFIENSLSGATWRRGGEGAQYGIRTEEHGETFRMLGVLTVLHVGRLPRFACTLVFNKY